MNVFQHSLVIALAVLHLPAVYPKRTFKIIVPSRVKFIHHHHTHVLLLNDKKQQSQPADAEQKFHFHVYEKANQRKNKNFKASDYIIPYVHPHQVSAEDEEEDESMPKIAIVRPRMRKLKAAGSTYKIAKQLIPVYADPVYSASSQRYQYDKNSPYIYDTSGEGNEEHYEADSMLPVVVNKMKKLDGFHKKLASHTKLLRVPISFKQETTEEEGRQAYDPQMFYSPKKVYLKKLKHPKVFVSRLQHSI